MGSKQTTLSKKMMKKNGQRKQRREGSFVNDGVSVMIVVVLYGEVEFCIYGGERYAPRRRRSKQQQKRRREEEGR